MTPLGPEGFADHFKASSQVLWCIAMAIVRDPAQAEDVLQEAALIALRKLDDFDPATAFAAWMGQIVRYVALNARRSGRRVATADPGRLDETGSAPSRPGPSGVTGRGELLPDQGSFDDQVLSALRVLDDTARACLLLRTVLDLPYREIARALSIPEGTAMSHVHRARRDLCDRLFETRGRRFAPTGASDG